MRASSFSCLCGRGFVTYQRSRRLAAVLFLALVLPTWIVFVAGAVGNELALRESEAFGEYVASGDGWSLYATLADHGAETSTCVDECAVRWPPFLVAEGGELPQGDGLDASLIGSVERPDGGRQVTYGDWPLYRFEGDEAPGDTEGHEVGDSWSLMSPEGHLVAADVAVDADAFDHLMAEGEQVYRNVCSTCHGGAGAGGQGPRLAANPRVGDTFFVVDTVLWGLGYMPGFGRQLSDADVAAVATYVRNSWANEYPLVPEEEVSRIR